MWERTPACAAAAWRLVGVLSRCLQAFPDLDAPDALELLALAPDPDRAAALTRRTLVAVFTRANRRGPQSRADAALGILRAPELRQPGPVQAAFAAIVTAEVALIRALNEQIDTLGRWWASILAGTRQRS